MITIGQTLNNTYEITEQLGSGSGGIIFKAYHKRMKKFVAIKLIKDEIKGGISNRSEVDVLKNLKNDYLPQVLDFVEDGDDVYTVMEFVEGQNFKQCICGGMQFNEAQVRKYALQLCEAVGYLHHHTPPIIHSDIKPANIMLTPDDNIVLIDFNISMMSRNGIAVSKGGSRDFAAPEQFRRVIKAPVEIDEFHEETRFIDSDETEIISDIQTESRQHSTSSTKNVERAYIDIRTDIYGIGASLYYILTGRVPQGSKPDFRGIKVSGQLRDIISKAMNPDPSARFRGVRDMEKALKERENRSFNKLAIALAVVGSVLIAAMFINKAPSDNEGTELPTLPQATETDTITSLTEPEEISTIESETGKANAVESETEKKNGVLEYYPGGKVKCEKISSNNDGSYSLMWYDEGGLKDVYEQYNEHGQIELVQIFISNGMAPSAVPELTENGYIITVEARNDKEYPYHKYVKNKDRKTEKVIYCDENKNEIFWRRYAEEYFDDGSHKTTWFEQDGSIFQATIYYLDGSHTTDFHNNGRKYLMQSFDANGNLTQSIRYDEENAADTSVTVPALETTVSTAETTKQTTITEKQVDHITIKGTQYHVSLTELDLQKQNLNDADIEQLKYMTNLEVLWLNNNNISNIEPLSGLVNLTELHLGYNQIVDISPLKNLRNMKVLGLKYNKISDITELGNLTNLVQLSFNSNNVSDISALQYLTNLERLWIFDNQISDISALRSCKKIIQLSMVKNNISDISVLSELNNICFLYMSDNPIEQINVVNYLPKLSILDISNTEVNDVTCLANKKKLTKLALYNTKVPYGEVDALKFEIPNCEIYTQSDFAEKIGIGQYE